MSKHRKTLAKIIAGSRNLPFRDVLSLAKAFGFEVVRISGSHHILSHPNVDEMLNLQPYKSQAKDYQLRQFIDLIERYELTLGEDRE